MKRPKADPQLIRDTFEILQTALDARIMQKGDGIFRNYHEISGVLTEEMNEFEEEVHNNHMSAIRSELLDVAVGALWGVVSIDSGEIERFHKRRPNHEKIT